MPSIPFNNTQVAFEHKSNADLKKAHWLFKSFKYPLLIKYGPVLANAFIGIIPGVKSIIKNTVFAQFCGGESINDCDHTIKVLSDSSIGTILDYSVEGEDDESEFDYTYKEIILTIEKAEKNRKDIPFCVFKTTGIGSIDLLEKVNNGESLKVAEQQAYDRIKDRFESICKKAHDADIPVFVDAEDSWIQDVIDDLTYQAMVKYNTKKAIVFNTIQCYRTHRVDHMREKLKSLSCFIGLKLVRGAYMEKERERAEKLGKISPIHKTKADTDAEYNNALRFCVEHIERVSFCAGTHNEESVQILADLLEKNNIETTHPHVSFAQLLGMSDHISFNLAKLNYNVAKYVPYGPVKSVMPYLSRRAQENSSVKGQVGRELNLIKIELERRSK
ncbi:MAG: proline dehydrogenase family protein [Bacteroidia bacterium]